jgi:elongation factor G
LISSSPVGLTRRSDNGKDVKSLPGDQMSNNPPLIEIAIEPRTESDRERLAPALVALAAEDSAFRFWTDQESGQTIIAGMGELHLDSKIDILMRTYNVGLYIGAPQVAYRETISRQVTKDYTHKKQTGGSGQFARIKIVCEPLPPGSASCSRTG